MRSDTALYYLFLGLTAAAFLVAFRMSRTRVGRSFIAIRDSETVATAYGIRPVRTKLTGFVVSGGIAALAGTMLTYQLGSVYVGYGSVIFSINWLANAVVAGITSVFGPIIGALFFGLYPELSKSAVSASNISHTFEILSAVLLIVIMAINPEGLASMGRFVRSRATAHAGDADDAADLDAIEAAATAEQHVEELVSA
jgi:branched-chain amino acid transport system permease protein